MQTVTGTFSVKMTPEPPYAADDGVTLARARFDKVFEGPLAGTSAVEFLSVRTADTAAYVALERFDVELEGRRGRFVATHRALATPAGKTLEVNIVEGTGTQQLVGITGDLSIEIVAGVHHYTLRYALAAP
ncbi:MAG: DUF3224 domain-containing protein [Myxococcales bacterium]|nr:DUF3224 domain-containing protein [Myxococcales bacterium]